MVNGYFTLNLKLACFVCFLKIINTQKDALKKKQPQVILSALCPLLCNSTRPQHTLQMFADHCGPRQTKPWETINQGLLQPQGELYPIQTIFNHRSRDQLLEFRTSLHASESNLSKELKNRIEILVGQSVLDQTFKMMFWSITEELLGLL